MMTEETLFELLRRTPEVERESLMDRACEGNPDLRARMVALLQADKTSSPISKLPLDLGPTLGYEAIPSYPAVNKSGTIIAARYKLLESIGEGGMGAVWMAQQLEPVKRLVAVKLIRPGMDSKAVLARFDAERQALAMMDHPNIAKVLDGGLAENSYPYFVMELVKGTPITQYCDERKLSLQQRLELFVPVCQAIQHAHQKGIIHRDIKPSNVLIALYDDKPVPKVIDFGVAKATGAQLTEQTLNTGFGAIVGTPEYMSPEQASLNNLDVDTRSDVYALGVLLYELLTGTTPVDRQSLKEAAVFEVLRIIREDEPPRPSTRLSTTEALPSIAANRHVEPARLSSLVKGELDWIVMKALEKDRSRRYETANGLAADVSRFLAGEPVTAVPASMGYRVQKFLRRNQGVVLAALLVFLALLLGMIGTTIGLFHADHQRSLAELARDDEIKQRRLAIANGERAKANFDQARAAVEKMLTRVGEQTLRDAPGFEQIRRQLLMDALAFHQEFLAMARDDASVQYDAAWAYHSVADISHELGVFKEADAACLKATQLFEKLLVESPSDRPARAGLASAIRLQAEIFAATGATGKIEPLLRRSAEMWSSLIQDFPDRIQYKRDLLQTLIVLYGKVNNRPGVAESLLPRISSLAVSLSETDKDRGSMFAAIQAFMLTAQSGLWNFEQKIQSADRMIKVLNASHSQLDRSSIDHLLVTLKGFRAQWLAKLNRKAEAEEEIRQTLECGRKLIAEYPSIPRHRYALSNAYECQADMLATQNRYPEAEAAFLQAVQLCERLVSDYPTNTEWQLALGMALIKMGMATVELQYGNVSAALKFSLSKKPPSQLMRSLDIYDKAVDVLGELVRRDPQNMQAREWLSNAYQWRGASWLNWEDAWEAAEDFKRAIQYAEPREQGRLKMVLWSADSDGKITELLQHANRMALRGKYEQASTLVDTQLKGPNLADNKYDAACVMSLCSLAVKRDARLPPEMQMNKVEDYALRAMALLKQAVEQGYRDVDHMKNDTDLDTLRTREDFKKLMAALATKAGKK